MSFNKNGKNKSYEELTITPEKREHMLKECIKYKENYSKEQNDDLSIRRLEKMKNEKTKGVFKMIAVASFSIAITGAMIFGMSKYHSGTNNKTALKTTEIDVEQLIREQDADWKKNLTFVFYPKERRCVSEPIKVDVDGDGVENEFSVEVSQKNSKKVDEQFTDVFIKFIIDGKIRHIEKWEESWHFAVNYGCVLINPKGETFLYLDGVSHYQNVYRLKDYKKSTIYFDSSTELNEPLVMDDIYLKSFDKNDLIVGYVVDLAYLGETELKIKYEYKDGEFKPSSDWIIEVEDINLREYVNGDSIVGNEVTINKETKFYLSESQDEDNYVYLKEGEIIRLVDVHYNPSLVPEGKKSKNGHIKGDDELISDYGQDKYELLYDRYHFIKEDGTDIYFFPNEQNNKCHDASAIYMDPNLWSGDKNDDSYKSVFKEFTDMTKFD